MLGHHDIPVELEEGGCSIRVTQSESGFQYTRELGDDRVEKAILADRCGLLVNPVEPVGLPNKLAQLLLIELEKPVLVEPGAKKSVMLTFPVEIGVFVTRGEEKADDAGTGALDVLTLAPKKLTLYGDPDNGHICKYWLTGVHGDLPEVDPYEAGILDLELHNKAGQWVEVTKTVMSAAQMKIYYTRDRVSLKAGMTITGESTAQVEVMDEPAGKNMEKSVELYRAGKMAVLSSGFVMEHGL